jgi:hypothetical protein
MGSQDYGTGSLAVHFPKRELVHIMPEIILRQNSKSKVIYCN